jgi:hypothetical protein
MFSRNYGMGIPVKTSKPEWMKNPEYVFLSTPLEDPVSVYLTSNPLKKDEVKYIRSDLCTLNSDMKGSIDEAEEMIKKAMGGWRPIEEYIDEAEAIIKKALGVWRPIEEYTEGMGYVDIWVKGWGRAVDYRLDIEDGYPDTWFPDNSDDGSVLASEVTHFMEIPEGPK